MASKCNLSAFTGVALICVSACGCSRPTGITGEQVATLRGHGDMIMGLTFSPDGKLLASGSHDGSVRIWDVGQRSEREVLRGHASGHFVLSVAFSRDGKYVASASSDKAVKIWNVATRKEEATLGGHADVVDSVAFSPIADMLASAATGDVFLWEVPTGKQIAKLETDTKNAAKLAFAPDGKALAVAGFSETIEIWDLTNFEKKAALYARGSPKFAVAYSANGTTIISLSRNSAVDQWDSRTLQSRGRLVGDRLSLENALSLAVFPDDRTIALSFMDGIKCLDYTTEKEVAFFPVRDGEKGAVMAIAVSPDGKTLAVADDVEIKLFDVATNN